MNKLILLLPLTIALLLPGCISCKKVVITCDIAKDFSTLIKIEYLGVHYSSTDIAEQKEEIGKIYQQTEEELLAEYFSDFPCYDKKVVLENKTDTSFDAIFSGEASRPTIFFSILSMGADDYLLEKNGDTLKFCVKAKFSNDSNNESEILNVRFAGEFVSHNAHSFDPETNTASWVFDQVGSDGIAFELKAK